MSGPSFLADPEDEIRVVALDGLTVLYHARSGMTHIIAPPAPEILEALRPGPATVAELMLRLAARYEMEAGGADLVALRLGELEQAGLVRRA